MNTITSIHRFSFRCVRHGRSVIYTFNTWDFAGQEEFYSTHQCFMSNRSLYLVSGVKLYKCVWIATLAGHVFTVSETEVVLLTTKHGLRKRIHVYKTSKCEMMVDEMHGRNREIAPTSNVLSRMVILHFEKKGFLAVFFQCSLLWLAAMNIRPFLQTIKGDITCSVMFTSCRLFGCLHTENGLLRLPICALISGRLRSEPRSEWRDWDTASVAAKYPGSSSQLPRHHRRHA